MADPNEDFFRELGLPFPSLPGNVSTILLKGLISASKIQRTLYEEHVNNGFSDREALALIMSLQKDVINGAAIVMAEFGKSGMDAARRQQEGGDTD